MNGSVAEWFIALVLKTSGLRGPGDSNSSASTKLNNVCVPRPNRERHNKEDLVPPFIFLFLTL